MINVEFLFGCFCYEDVCIVFIDCDFVCEYEVICCKIKCIVVIVFN